VPHRLAKSAASQSRRSHEIGILPQAGFFPCKTLEPDNINVQCVLFGSFEESRRQGKGNFKKVRRDHRRLIRKNLPNKVLLN
jgi:hypothetical protein